MAVYRAPSRSPPPPPSQCEVEIQAETDKTSVASETETDDTQQTQAQPTPSEPEKEEEKAGAERRRARWLCSLFPKRAPREGKKKKKSLWQRSIMGKLSGWFKKSDDKEKPGSPSVSNPYAQQQPVGQATPPPQYDQYTQYNNQQYNDNQHISQPSQGPPSGLPSGPRPGGLPSRVAPGPRTGTFESNKTSGAEKSPPPQYSPHGSQPPPYGRGSPSLSSAGGTPVIPSNTSSPSMGAGFSKEKYGAQDAVGRNRFEPAQSPYGNPTPPPSQRQGGYGNLDDGREALFGNYNNTPQQTSNADFPQHDAPSGTEQTFVDRSNMTAEERDNADYQDTKAVIDETRNATESSLDRSLANAQRGREQNRALLETVLRQGEILAHANSQSVESELQAARGNLNVKDLGDATGSMFKSFTARSRAAKLDDEKLRQELEATQKRQEAQALKREGFGRGQQGMMSRPKQMLGSRPDPAQRKNFALEEEDEVQEERIEGKLGLLHGAIRDIRDDGETMRGVIAQQNVLVQNMEQRTARVQDSITTSQNRMNRIR